VDTASALLLGTGRAVLTLTGTAPLVARARDLALAALTLEGDRLRTHIRSTRQEGDIGVSRELTALTVVGAETVADDGQAIARISLDLGVTLAFERALGEGEGVPIVRIGTPGAAGAGALSLEPVIEGQPVETRTARP
jgi:hypothetical protein